MNVIRNQASSKFRNDRQMSPHTTARPSDAREVTTGVWLMSRDQFDAVHADSHFHSYVTPVHCRISLLIHHAIANSSAGMCFFGCSHLRPDVKEPMISLDEETSVRFWRPADRSFLLSRSTTNSFCNTEYIWKYTLCHTKYGVMNQQLTNILDVPCISSYVAHVRFNGRKPQEVAILRGPRHTRTC